MKQQNGSSSSRTRKMTYAALYLGIALALPFITGQIPEIGSMLCPMHIPVLLCGFLCGWPWGLAVGLIAPLLRSVLFGMPVMFPTAVAMAFELAAYGLSSGYLYRVFPRIKGRIYMVLIIAMIAGRLVWGGAQLILSGLIHSEFTPALFLAGAVTNAIPGIVLHIILIPVVVMAMERSGLSLNN